MRKLRQKGRLWMMSRKVGRVQIVMDLMPAKRLDFIPKPFYTSQ